MNQSTSQTFKLCSKAFFLTYPQCPETKEDLRDYLKGKGDTESVVVSRELHESGEPHLHAYVKYKSQKTARTKTFDFKGHHPNVQSCKNYYAVVKYIKKDKDYLEEGIDTKQYVEARENKKSTIGAKLIKKEQTVEQAVAENPELIFQYGTLKKNVENYLLNTTPHEDFERVNYWIVGEPGIGKSQWVRRTFKSLYTKAQNKWWDGYRGEEAVLLDDLDSNTLGHYLKIWGDNYAITGEIKGGTIPLPYKQMIITSNYMISQLWREDKTMAAAIARRFKTYTVTGDYQSGYELADYPGYLEY